jgi:hypothetical protein
MRVEPTKQATFQLPTGSFGQNGAPDHSNDGKPQSRALVATVRAITPEPAARPRQAAFLAHLIATKHQAPQTRERRRAEPHEAIAAYRTVAAIARA